MSRLYSTSTRKTLTSTTPPPQLTVAVMDVPASQSGRNRDVIGGELEVLMDPSLPSLRLVFP
jgi:hypothetical protein